MIMLVLASLLATASKAEPPESPPQFLLKWGTEGFREGQFAFPVGIAVGGGNVYVADFNNDRIQQFDSNGTFLALWCSLGKPYGLAVSRTGDVYFTDYRNHRVAKHDANGNFLLDWGSQGSGDGQFNLPLGIAIDRSGNVYVADGGNHRVQRFDANGTFLTKWSSGFPRGVGVDATGFVYVTELVANRVVKSDNVGSFVAEWTQAGNEQFASLEGVTVDASGNVYVVSVGSHRVYKFDGSGALLTSWGSLGSGDGEFYSPHYVAVSGNDVAYVADHANHRIQAFGFPPISTKPGTWSWFKGKYLK